MSITTHVSQQRPSRPTRWLQASTFALVANVQRLTCFSRVAGAFIALVLLLSASQANANSGLFADYVVLTTNGTQNYYDTNNPTSNPDFTGNLGSFTRGAGTLVLNGAEVNTFKNGSSNIASARIRYRIYATAGTGGGFLSLNLPYVNGSDTPSGTGSTNQTWQQTGSTIDLTKFVNADGNYTIEVYFEATDSGIGTTPTDNNGGSNYKATFTVTGTPTGTPSNGITTTWTGILSSSWNDNGNWDNGIPTAATDAVFPPFAAQSNLQSATINNSSEVDYVHNITLQGTSTISRAVVRVNTGELRVYGDFVDQASGFIHNAGTVTMAGGNQTLSSALFATLKIDGTGIKTINTRIQIGVQLLFATGTTAIVQTQVSDPNNFSVDLNAQASVSGESNTAGVVGILRVDRNLQRGTPENFGNIGVTVTVPVTSPNDPSTTYITRTTGLFYTGVNSSKGIKRIFGIRPTGTTDGTANGPSANNNLNATLTFKYYNTTDELNGNTEANLQIFQTGNNGGSFSPRGGTVDLGTQTVTTSSVNVLQTFTLADSNNPLPVTLTSFTALRSGKNTTINWSTASEVDNKGFEVQVSTDGLSFRALTFVASQSPNSLTAREYNYLDVEAGKKGIRYYRLMQVDYSGKTSYSGVKVVDFNGAAATNVLTTYPNPFTDSFALVTATNAVHVTLVDATGRLVREQDISSDSNATISNLDGLNAGIYLAKVTLADGSTQTVRIQKR